MTSVLSAAESFGLFAASECFKRRDEMCAVEKRQRLSGREAEMEAREIIGKWVDERPEQGDSLVLYKEAGRVFLQTWFSDGCHSCDEMTVTPTPNGTCLEDKGGNFFGEFFVMTRAGLEFHNQSGCFYTAPTQEPIPVG